MPLYQSGAFDYTTAMALATLLGLGFGFVLERAGFGRASVLVSQFFGNDMRVLKVMFSAIATTAVGIGVLAGAGVLDTSLLVIPETFVVPHIVGGALLGLGFVASGYCPGTAIVATASGYLDGVVALVGIMIGTLIFGFVYEPLQGFYEMTPMGSITFVQLLDIPWPVIAFAVAVMAVGAFVGGEWVERWLARRNQAEPPAGNPHYRSAVYVGLVAMAALGLVTLGVPAQAARVATPEVSDYPTIDSVTLASELSTGREEVYVVDLRSRDDCVANRIRGAMCRPEDDNDGAFVAALPATRTLVLYAAHDLQRIPPSVAEYEGPVQVLGGGFAAFRAQVLTEPVAPERAGPEEVHAYRERAALYEYFTGADAPPPPVVARPVTAERSARRGGGC
ncbi:MAG: YeeE/YedE family protein [Myxococcales bacterium]|nr:YeeE/YedE family protein [Myxococcales bacterium]